MLRTLALVLACLACLFSCAPDEPDVPVEPEKPAEKLPPQLVPALDEEVEAVLERLVIAVSTDALATAVDRSLVYVTRRALAQKPDAIEGPLQTGILAGDTPISWHMLAQSLAALRDALPHLQDDPGLLTREFAWFRLAPRTLLTGYYEPLLLAAHEPSPEYPYPIYGRPDDLKTVDLGLFREDLAGRRLTYRVVFTEDGNEIAPYHDRAAIDYDGALQGRNLEIAWVNDAFELFSLHIQGSGRLQFPDGTVRNVLYAAQNGHKYVSLGREMADRGFMELSAVSMPRIRDYLLANPELIPELLSTNPSYVFFKLADEGPFGSIGQVLTPMASLAVDRTTIPLGAPVILDTHLPPPPGEVITPDTVGQPFVSLMLAQDTGGAIKGTRADLFCGFGDDAYAVAGRLKAPAAMYVLLSKEVLAAD